MKYCAYCKKDRPDGDFNRECKMCSQCRNQYARNKAMLKKKNERGYVEQKWQYVAPACSLI